MKSRPTKATENECDNFFGTFIGLSFVVPPCEKTPPLDENLLIYLCKLPNYYWKAIRKSPITLNFVLFQVYAPRRKKYMQALYWLVIRCNSMPSPSQSKRRSWVFERHTWSICVSTNCISVIKKPNNSTKSSSLNWFETTARTQQYWSYQTSCFMIILWWLSHQKVRIWSIE